MNIGPTLVQRGLITAPQLNQVQNQGGDLLTHLVEAGYVTREKAMKALAEELGVEFVDLRETKVDLSFV